MSDIKRISKRIGVPEHIVTTEMSLELGNDHTYRLAKELSKDPRIIALNRGTQRLLLHRKRE